MPKRYRNVFLARIKHLNGVTAMLVAYDIITIVLSYFSALLLRFDFHYMEIPVEYMNPFRRFIPVYVALCIVIFAVLRLYRSIWRFASYDELLRVIEATIITGGLHIVLISAFFGRMPISYFMMGITLQFVFTIGVRFAYRFIILLRSNNSSRNKTENVMVIGMSNIIRVT